MAWIDAMRSLTQDRRGATALEYGLLASLITLALVGGLTLFGSSVDKYYNNLSKAPATFSTTPSSS